VMVLSQTDAALAGVYANGAAAAMTTANGSTEMRWAAIRDLQIGGHQLTDVQAAIAQGAHVSLIGQNVLSKLDSVEMTGERLVLR
jgi:aspartyl protease family protein